MFLPVRWLKPVVVGTVVGCAGMWLAIYSTGEPESIIHAVPVLCCDAVRLGALLALIKDNKVRQRLATGALWVGLPCWLISEVSTRAGIEGFVLPWMKQKSVLLVFLWLVHRAAVGFRRTVGRVLEARVLVGLGTISYGLYVIHSFAPRVLVTLERLLNLPDSLTRSLLMRVALLLAITIALAWVTWQILELPIQGWKRHFPYRRKRVDTRAARSSDSGPQPVHQAA